MRKVGNWALILLAAVAIVLLGVIVLPNSHIWWQLAGISAWMAVLFAFMVRSALEAGSHASQEQLTARIGNVNFNFTVALGQTVQLTSTTTGPIFSPAAPSLLEVDPNVKTEPILGYRLWRIMVIDGKLRLVSTFVYAIWEPFKPITGDVDAVDPAGIPLGVYAYRREFSAESSKNMPTIYGIVALWGKVVEHEDGYRAEKAYPVKLTSVGCNRCGKMGNSKEFSAAYGADFGLYFYCKECIGKRPSPLSHLVVPAGYVIELLEREYGLGGSDEYRRSEEGSNRHTEEGADTFEGG